MYIYIYIYIYVVFLRDIHFRRTIAPRSHFCPKEPCDADGD